MANVCESKITVTAVAVTVKLIASARENQSLSEAVVCREIPRPL